jgi:rifampicin phosphotransferase
MQVYGMRGIGEIDIGRTPWQADASPVIQVLKSYLQIEATDASPAAVFQRGAKKAELAGQRLVQTLRQTRGGWLKARVAGWQIGRVRQLAGLRETPKFAVIRLFSGLRQGLLAAGQKLVAQGALTQADDVFFLHLGELKALTAGEQQDWPQRVAERRRTFAREMRRRQWPRLMLSDGTAFYTSGRPAGPLDEKVLVGNPVSAGSVEGLVHVIVDPRAEQLTPGEILVCPATDPAWTPLFLAAGGLVMEVGGLMTHGAVVAREYGIPAVVGVSQATTRLKTGQRVRVDGSSGRVECLDTDG